MKPKLLIVDDGEEIRTQMKWALAGDYEVFLAEDRPTALEIFRAHQPPVVLLDLGLPPHPSNPTEGLAALTEMLALDRLVKVIIISGQGEKENALQAIGAGAYDFCSSAASTSCSWKRNMPNSNACCAATLLKAWWATARRCAVFLK